jgi:hypothetical protein
VRLFFATLLAGAMLVPVRAPAQGNGGAALPALPAKGAPPVSYETAPAAALPRPRLTVAIGPGMTFESAGLSGTHAVPAFFATGGFGADWRVGGELAVFASSALGRFKAPDDPVDRLAASGIAVVRPLAWALAADDARYAARLLRATGLEVGLGLERDATSLRSGSRWGLHLGGRVEVPLGPAGQASELRLRLGARRMQGFYTPTVAMTEVGNTLELYTALVTVF